MNHTDRFNYWPFQYKLWRAHGRYTATWVKGKNYESPFTAKFMELTNNIPIVSRGYLITRDCLSTLGRVPDDREYEALRTAVDAAAHGDADGIEALRRAVPAVLLDRPRDILGRFFDPAGESYPQAIDRLFREMMRRFVRLNEQAFEKGLDLLVFPQGTRSIRLSRGHGGLGQIALRFRRTIVPVGCNGSDRIYPGTSPVARGGRVVYRFGEPIRWDGAARPFQILEPFEPFTPEADAAHRERFQGLVDLVMDRINDLLDGPYRYGADRESDGTRGAARFL
jgi:hypothetical protein